MNIQTPPHSIFTDASVNARLGPIERNVLSRPSGAQRVAWGLVIFSAVSLSLLLVEGTVQQTVVVPGLLVTREHALGRAGQEPVGFLGKDPLLVIDGDRSEGNFDSLGRLPQVRGRDITIDGPWGAVKETIAPNNNKPVTKLMTGLISAAEVCGVTRNLAEYPIPALQRAPIERKVAVYPAFGCVKVTTGTGRQSVVHWLLAKANNLDEH